MDLITADGEEGDMVDNNNDDKNEDQFIGVCEEKGHSIEHFEPSFHQELLFKMIGIAKHALQTNVYMNNCHALGLRHDPKIMIANGEPERDLSYGISYVHGRRLNDYHIRFRDIAWGEMRLVTPSSSEQFALESAHHYDECYGLTKLKDGVVVHKVNTKEGVKARNSIHNCTQADSFVLAGGR